MGRGETDGVAPLLRDALVVRVDGLDEDGVRVGEVDRVPVREGARERVRVLVHVNVTVLDGVAPRESVGVTGDVRVIVLVRVLANDRVEDAVGHIERVGLVLRVKAEGEAPVLRLAEGEADWLGVGVPDGSTTLKVMIASLCRSREVGK